MPVCVCLGVQDRRWKAGALVTRSGGGQVQPKCKPNQSGKRGTGCEDQSNLLVDILIDATAGTSVCSICTVATAVRDQSMMGLGARALHRCEDEREARHTEADIDRVLATANSRD